MENKNNLKNSENNNLSIITMDNITEILKRKIDKQINTFVKHKASKKAFNNCINSLENDKTKLKKINSQLGNLSKNVNTLPKLFKSFTSEKRSKKIKSTMEKKKFIQALPEIEPEPEIIIKPTKVERKEKYEKKKKAVKESKTEIKPRELKKNDRKIYKQALNNNVEDIDIYNDKFTIEKTYNLYLKEQNEIRERRINEIKNMSERDCIIMLSDINDTTHIIPKDEYIPINIPNKELLCDTIESNLIDILINNKKEYNIFANIVICYIKKVKIDEEENEYSKEFEDFIGDETEKEKKKG